MEFKGTKGKWQASGTDIFVNDMGMEIAQAYCSSEKSFSEWNNEDFIEAHANAQLMAAAPDMLEALLYVKNCLDIKEGNVCFECTIDELNTKVQSSIKKALGKEK